jgi:hypothetical protein
MKLGKTLFSWISKLYPEDFREAHEEELLEHVHEEREHSRKQFLGSLRFSGVEPPQQVRVGWASRNLFSLLGIAPILGPGFTEDSPPGTLVLSYYFWRDVFGSDPDVVGKTVRLDDHPYTVSGVLPRGFR